MEATRALHMKGGTEDKSYSNNSSLQRKSITSAMTIMEEAIKDVYCKTFPKTLCISDMGCSSGPNSIYAVSMLMDTVDRICQSLGHESPEFLIHLNDLPSNDFNTIFRSFPKLQEERTGRGFGPCFLTGVPGSFYERLFPPQSLHFVFSSNSLHWLSQAPEEAHDNKGNIYISTTSSPNVVNAYLKQFNKDFSTFLRCRAVELITGGCMVLTLVGRRREDPRAWESQGIFGPLSKAINDMVDEGLIEKEKLDSFNVPLYKPSVSELKSLIEEEGSFSIIRVGIADLRLHEDKVSTPDFFKNVGLNAAKTSRAIYEPLLSSHFGECKMDEMFSRLAEIFSDCMSKDIMDEALNVTLFLTRKRDP